MFLMDARQGSETLLRHEAETYRRVIPLTSRDPALR